MKRFVVLCCLACTASTAPAYVPTPYARLKAAVDSLNAALADETRAHPNRPLYLLIYEGTPPLGRYFVVVDTVAPRGWP